MMIPPKRGAAHVRKLIVRCLLMAENGVVSLLLLAMACIPFAEYILRGLFHTGIPGAQEYLQHLTLWIAFLGACVASREGRHLNLAALERFSSDGWRSRIHYVNSIVPTVVCLWLVVASVELLVSEAPALSAIWRERLPEFFVAWLEPYGLFEAGTESRVAGWIPIWIAESAMPIGFAIMAVRFVHRSSKRWLMRGGCAAIVFLFMWIPGCCVGQASHWVWPAIIVLIISAVLGAPIFILLAGAALTLFWGAGETLAAIPAETYRIVTYPVFPTIPIFTLAGFILSQSRAGERLVRVFQAWFGWMPGGTAVAATILCAFFTTFTGASGVTILALGGLLLPVLIESGFKSDFSVGLLTATGSLGLLLPPSLVVILYAVMARVSPVTMFKAALVPGILLVTAIAVYCVGCGRTSKVQSTPFSRPEAFRALWAAKWEVLIPILALWLIFGGFCTLVESASVIVVYALVIESIVYRDLKPSDVGRILVQCATLVGGVLIILGVAMGLTSYLVDAQVPMVAAEWVGDRIQSRVAFLLMLNVGLILVGCLMDIFSALVVMVPILLPMAEVYGVDPIHLGVIFLANLELGYLTPPIGMNLFLASFRFEKPLPEVYRASWPFLFILLIVVLLVTFVPWLTLGIFV